MQLQTNTATTGREQFGLFEPFDTSTRLYLTLPNGQRTGFDFTPTRQAQSGFDSFSYYLPAWTSEARRASGDKRRARGRRTVREEVIKSSIDVILNIGLT